MDVTAPVTDYLNRGFFTDNEKSAYNGANVNVLTNWLTVVTLDLGTIYNGERILFTCKWTGNKTTDSTFYVRLAKDSGTGFYRFTGVTTAEIGDVVYRFGGEGQYGTIVGVANVYTTGTCIVKLEAVNLAGSMLCTTPHCVINAQFLRKL